jgi:hypothetical protein
MKMQTVPLSRLKANPTNPRVLRDDKFAKLKRSIEEFPDMLNYRAFVCRHGQGREVHGAGR